MRYEARHRRGGRCRVRAQYIGIKINLQNPRQCNRAMQKSIEQGFIMPSYSFSGHNGPNFRILANLSLHLSEIHGKL